MFLPSLRKVADFLIENTKQQLISAFQLNYSAKCYFVHAIYIRYAVKCFNNRFVLGLDGFRFQSNYEYHDFSITSVSLKVQILSWDMFNCTTPADIRFSLLVFSRAVVEL